MAGVGRRHDVVHPGGVVALARQHRGPGLEQAGPGALPASSQHPAVGHPGRSGREVVGRAHALTLVGTRFLTRASPRVARDVADPLPPRVRPRCLRPMRRPCSGATPPIRTGPTVPRSGSVTGSGPTPSSRPSRCGSPTCCWPTGPPTRRRWRPGVRPTSGSCRTTPPTTCSPSAGAAFAGATVVGLNPTRVGEHLLRDIDHTDVDRHPHRARSPRRPGRPRPGRSAGDRVAPLRRGVQAVADRGGAGDLDLEAALADVSAGGPPRRRVSHRPMGPHLHLGHVGRTQGRDLHATAADGHRQPHDHHARHRSRRRGLRGHAPVPLQRGHGRAGRPPSWPVPRWVWLAGSACRAGCPTSAATAPPGSTTPASRCRTWWPRPTQPDDRRQHACGWPSATRVLPRCSTGSPSASGSR